MNHQQTTRPEGYETTVHMSLVEPILVVGLPRSVAFSYWTIAAALIIGMHQLWILPVALIGHIALTRLTKFDPYFMEVVRTAIKNTKDKHP